MGTELSEQVESIPSGVDREKGVISDVKIVGLSSPSKRRRYEPAALKNAMHLYEGARVNINHQSAADRGDPRRYEDRIGRIKGVYFREGEGLYARELQFNTAHPWAESLVWWAHYDPNGVGLSHSANGQTRTEKGVQVVESILEVFSVDLVGEAATTNGLYEGEPQSIADLTASRSWVDSRKQRAKDCCQDSGLWEENLSESFVNEMVCSAESDWPRLVAQRKLSKRQPMTEADFDDLDRSFGDGLHEAFQAMMCDFRSELENSGSTKIVEGMIKDDSPEPDEPDLDKVFERML